MQAETRHQITVAIEEMVLLEDPTYTRPASTDQQHDEYYCLCYHIFLRQYRHLSKGNAFLQTGEAMVAITTESYFDQQVTTSSSAILQPYKSRDVLDQLVEYMSNNMDILTTPPHHEAIPPPAVTFHNEIHVICSRCRFQL